jgi:hypothetical protein
MTSLKKLDEQYLSDSLLLWVSRSPALGAAWEATSSDPVDPDV